MKKFTMFLLAACTALSLCACGGGNDDKNATSTQTPEATPTPTPKVYDASAAAENYAGHKWIELWENPEDVPFSNGQTASTPKLFPYIASGNTTGGCIIICPGGGYVSLARDKEGIDVAEAFNEQNITAFMLQYRTGQTYEAVLSDVFRAIRYVRAHADDFAIDPDKIAIMGFSAGGHLATMALEHSEEDSQQFDEIDNVSAKPNFGILCYPVISLKPEKTHALTAETFLGADRANDSSLIEKYSGEEGVTKDTPPVFIWHCKGDQAVPYSNSKDFAAAMEKVNAPCELHLYEGGNHGIGLGADAGDASVWFADCVKWLQGYGY